MDSGLRRNDEALVYQVIMLGGPTENRTRVQGFAVLCVTTPPSGLTCLAETAMLERSPNGLLATMQL